MSTVETASEFRAEGADFSIDEELLKRAREILGPHVSPEYAARWNKSITRAIFLRGVIGFIGSIPAFPFLVAEMGLVQIFAVDRPRSLFLLKDGFVGEGNEWICVSTLPKIPTLKRGVMEHEATRPELSTFAQGGRAYGHAHGDGRVHSQFGALLRQYSLDELPQIPAVLLGIMDGVGPRGYTRIEADWLIGLFQKIDSADPAVMKLLINVPPEWMAIIKDKYRATVSLIRPKIGFAGLYSATERKGLAPLERLLLDHMLLNGDNFIADWNIIKATVGVVLHKTGTG